MISLQHYLILSLVLFSIGAIGAVARRNILIVMVSIATMFCASILAIISFARWNLLPSGRGIVIVLMALGAAMILAGFSIVAAINARTGSIYSDRFNLLKG
ncbi:MAG: NADH-quinone oxidoreductase subunit K [bacterium ADurb.Bin270]|nr:NADH-quinone oxidoreductase subunit K [Myxococcales bacterium]OQA62134.1 MAG: NADH-quinone oxidoreductase subunit K [bacterium ADurb.Bin270]